MGLTISVGVIVPGRFEGDRADSYAEHTGRFCSIVTCLNRELAARGLPTHSEPISVDGKPLDLNLGSPANLHALRRVAAHLWYRGRLPHANAEGPPDQDEALLEYRAAIEEHIGGGLRAKRIVHLPLMSYAHLVYHGSADGWYIPIDMEMPLLLEVDEVATQRAVGSVQALQRECTHLASALKMPVNLNPRDPSWARRDLARGGPEPWRRHRAAAWACCSLLAACRASVRWGAVIAFGMKKPAASQVVEPAPVRAKGVPARIAPVNGASAGANGSE